MLSYYNAQWRCNKTQFLYWISKVTPVISFTWNRALIFDISRNSFRNNAVEIVWKLNIVCYQQSTLVFNQIFVRGKIDSQLIDEEHVRGLRDFPRGYLILIKHLEREKERHFSSLFLLFKIISNQLSSRRFIWKEEEAFVIHLYQYWIICRNYWTNYWIYRITLCNASSFEQLPIYRGSLKTLYIDYRLGSVNILSGWPKWNHRGLGEWRRGC